MALESYFHRFTQVCWKPYDQYGDGETELHRDGNAELVISDSKIPEA